ncbi:hypothetical protein ES703_93653 [subsurface metagenome]
MLNISKEFVERWSDEYDKRSDEHIEVKVEREIRDWLAKQHEPKYLDKEHFVKLGWWKSRRQINNYKANPEILIKEATRLAYEASDKKPKLHILQILKGVQVPVASTILHFLHPNKFPIFDIHVRVSLKNAGKWKKSTDDASAEAWLEYIDLMRGLSNQLGVSLRDLDKALWAYDKWGTKTQNE